MPENCAGDTFRVERFGGMPCAIGEVFEANGTQAAS